MERECIREEEQINVVRRIVCVLSTIGYQSTRIHFDGYSIVFNTHIILIIIFISSSSLSNLKSNNYNKNDTRRKTTTPIQYSRKTSVNDNEDDNAMMTTATTITITMINTSATDRLG